MPSSVKTEPFRFKQFSIEQDRCPMKINTDGVLLGAWADVSDCRTALDIGTGTGVIAIMLAQRSEALRIHAVEIDADACEQARRNMAACPWAERLEAFHASIQQYSRQTEQRYDLIVSNPPFFTGGTFSSNENRTMVRHTVKLPHGDLLAAVRTLLQPSGRFCVVLPYLEGLRFRELASSYHLYCTRLMEVRPKADKPVSRLLLQFERHPRPLQSEELVIQGEGPSQWTEAYVALTGAFYLYL